MITEQENDGSKATKAFEGNLKTLIALLGGKEQLFPSNKVDGDLAAEIVSTLFKEERENNEKELKDKIKSILSNYAAMQNEFKAKEKEFAQLKEKKYKEFNEAIRQVFDRIKNLKDIEKEYYAALNGGGNTITSGPTPEAPAPPAETL